MYPQPGYVEINPDDLWQSIVQTIRNAIGDAKLKPADISCLGISTQRSTFITWDRITGETFHNFVTWKDLRADSMVRKWNDSVTLKVIHYIFNNCLFDLIIHPPINIWYRLVNARSITLPVYVYEE